MKNPQIAVAAINLLRHLCWVCVVAFGIQTLYLLVPEVMPMIAESMRPVFVTAYDSTQFDHTGLHKK